MSDTQLIYIAGEANPNKRSNPFQRVFYKLYFSEAYRTLTPAARDMFVGLGILSHGNSRFKASYSQLNQIAKSPQTIKGAIDQLIEHGFIERDEQAKKGHWDAMHYKLSNKWTEYNSP